jgi:hypothetical protein
MGASGQHTMREGARAAEKGKDNRQERTDRSTDFVIFVTHELVFEHARLGKI